jgi:integrase
MRVQLRATADTLFVSATGNVPSHNTVQTIFLRLAGSVGLRGEPGQRGPRIHDLRHTFAVRSLERCSNDANAVARHLVALTTYLGHAHVTDTYWYLQATPILMAQIAAVSETVHRGSAP